MDGLFVVGCVVGGLVALTIRALRDANLKKTQEYIKLREKVEQSELDFIEYRAETDVALRNLRLDLKTRSFNLASVQAQLNKLPNSTRGARL